MPYFLFFFTSLYFLLGDEVHRTRSAIHDFYSRTASRFPWRSIIFVFKSGQQCFFSSFKTHFDHCENKGNCVSSFKSSFLFSVILFFFPPSPFHLSTILRICLTNNLNTDCSLHSVSVFEERFKQRKLYILRLALVSSDVIDSQHSR